MSETSLNLSHFVADIQAHPDDPAPCLAACDWLQEKGWHDLAPAYHWMGRRGYRPGLRRRPRALLKYAWWHAGSKRFHYGQVDRIDMEDVRNRRAIIPYAVFQAMRVRGPHVYAKTYAGAVEALARALKRLTSACSLERQPGDPT